jgi:drug/metabolite transporter (DMT)-like permease
LSAASQGGRGYLVVGALLTAGGAMLFAIKGILAKALYAQGAGFELLVAGRALLSLPMFWAFTLCRESWDAIHSTPLRPALLAAFAGTLCYYVGAMTDFLALTMIEASLERVLLFSYPAVVVVLTSLVSRSWPQPIAIASALVAYVGIFFAVGGLDLAELRANLLGASLVLVSSFAYAVYFVIGEHCTRRIGSARFTLFAMSAATVACLLHFSLRADTAEVLALPVAGWALLFALGVFCMFVPALMQSEGMRRIGAQRGSVVSTLGPPTTILLGWALLGERLTATQIAGVVLIVGSVLVIELVRMAPRRAA